MLLRPVWPWFPCSCENVLGPQALPFLCIHTAHEVLRDNYVKSSSSESSIIVSPVRAMLLWVSKNKTLFGPWDFECMLASSSQELKAVWPGTVSEPWQTLHPSREPSMEHIKKDFPPLQPASLDTFLFCANVLFCALAKYFLEAYLAIIMLSSLNTSI